MMAETTVYSNANAMASKAAPWFNAIIMCQMWVHPECVGEVEKEIVTLWCCQSCRQMPTLVEKILQKVTALESCVTTIQESNQQLIALVQEQREEMRSLREDVPQKKRVACRMPMLPAQHRLNPQTRRYWWVMSYSMTST